LKARILLMVVLCACAYAQSDAVATPPTVNPNAPVVAGTDAIEIPLMFSYQGKLTDTFGIPVADTTHSATFRLYTEPTGGSPYWNETQTIRTRGGLFSTLVGSITDNWVCTSFR